MAGLPLVSNWYRCLSCDSESSLTAFFCSRATASVCDVELAPSFQASAERGRWHGRGANARAHARVLMVDAKAGSIGAGAPLGPPGRSWRCACPATQTSWQNTPYRTGLLASAHQIAPAKWFSLKRFKAVALGVIGTMLTRLNVRATNQQREGIGPGLDGGDKGTNAAKRQTLHPCRAWNHVPCATAEI